MKGAVSNYFVGGETGVYGPEHKLGAIEWRLAICSLSHSSVVQLRF